MQAMEPSSKGQIYNVTPTPRYQESLWERRQEECESHSKKKKNLAVKVYVSLVAAINKKRYEFKKSREEYMGQFGWRKRTGEMI